MPLYECDAISASKNIFISSLFNYRKKRYEIKQKEDEADISEIANLSINAIFDYGKAIEFAIEATSASHLDKKEREDFRDWLLWNKKTMAGVFLDLADMCIKYREDKRAEFINKQLIEYIQKILSIEEETNKEIIPLPEGFDTKQKDLDQTRNVVIKYPHKEQLRKNYAQRFFEFLRTLERHNLLDNWYREEANKSWVKGHYEALTIALENNASFELDEFAEAWSYFNKELAFLENEEVRKSRLDDQVEKSIELCFQWEKMTQLEQVQARIEQLIKQTQEMYQSALANIKPVGKRVRDFVGAIFGTVLWPLMAPICWGVDKRLGTKALPAYNAFLAENRERASNFIHHHPWLAISIVGGLFGTILLGVTGGVLLIPTLSVITELVIHTGMTVGIGIAGGLIGGYAIGRYSYTQEITAVSIKYEEKIKKLTSGQEGEFGKIEQKHDCELKNSRNIAEQEKEKEKSEEVREVYEFITSRQQTRLKNRNEKPVRSYEDKILEDQMKMEKEAAQLFSEATPSELKAAEQEYKEMLADMEKVLLVKVRENKANIEAELAKGAHVLRELNIKQMNLRKDLNLERTSRQGIMVINPNTSVAYPECKHSQGFFGASINMSPHSSFEMPSVSSPLLSIERFTSSSSASSSSSFTPPTSKSGLMLPLTKKDRKLVQDALQTIEDNYELEDIENSPDLNNIYNNLKILLKKNITLTPEIRAQINAILEEDQMAYPKN